MTPAQLKDFYERQRRILTRRPAFARANANARVHLRGDVGHDVIGCHVVDGAWSAQFVIPPEHGGLPYGPHPGQLMRATLGVALATGYRFWGACLDVDIGDIEIDVLCEHDLRGELAICDDVPVGWRRIVFDIRICSAASDADIQRVVATADRLNTVLACLSPAIERLHRLRVVRPFTATATAAAVAVATERPVPSDVTPSFLEAEKPNNENPNNRTSNPRRRPR